MIVVTKDKAEKVETQGKASKSKKNEKPAK